MHQIFSPPPGATHHGKRYIFSTRCKTPRWCSSTKVSATGNAWCWGQTMNRWLDGCKLWQIFVAGQWVWLPCRGGGGRPARWGRLLPASTVRSQLQEKVGESVANHFLMFSSPSATEGWDTGWRMWSSMPRPQQDEAPRSVRKAFLNSFVISGQVEMLPSAAKVLLQVFADAWRWFWFGRTFWSSLILICEGGGPDLAPHAGHRHLLPGHHGRLPRDGVRGCLLQPSWLDAGPPSLRVPCHRPGWQASGWAWSLLVQGGAGALATCKTLSASSHNSLRTPQTQTCLPGKIEPPPSWSWC